jgi:hypothetical protein
MQVIAVSNLPDKKFKRYIMKSLNLIQLLSSWLLLASIGLTLTFAGCAGSPGKTSQEVHRQHVNYINTNWLMLQQDIDEFLMIDRPSRLSDMISR